MAKKTFKDNLGKREYLNVINTGKKEQKGEIEETPKKPIKQKSEKPTYQPHTLKIRTDVWEAAQALAWWERASFQGFFTKILEAHIDTFDPRELKEIVEKYKKHKKK